MFDLLNFSVDQEAQTYQLAKRALIFIEGEHKDSMGRLHNFPVSRIKEFVDNTNNFLRQGGRLPFQMDHKKTQDFNIGDVEGELYIKKITPEDLPNPAFKHLVGKAGVFVDNIVGKGRDVVEKINSGLIKTLSPGLDPLTKSFIEISATPTPAIIGPALFSKEGDELDNLILFESVVDAKGYEGAPNVERGDSDSKAKAKAYSFDALKKQKMKAKKMEEDFEELSEDLFEILHSIYSSTDEELAAESINPVEASYDAIEYFLSNLEEMFGLVETDEEQEDKRKKYMANGASDYPVGKIPSDYNKNIESNSVLEFSKKTIGFVKTRSY